MSLKKIFSLIVFLMAPFLCSGSSLEHNIEKQSEDTSKERAKERAKKVVTEANKKTEEVFRDEQKKYGGMKESEKKDAQSRDLKGLFSAHAHVPSIARLVLPRTKQGKSLWKQMSQEQKSQYIDLFQEEVVAMYYNMLDVEYKKRSALDIRDAQIIPRKRGYLVRVHGIFKSTPPVSLMWTLSKGKIIDLRVEGASLVQAKKAEFQVLARQCMRSDGTIDVDSFLSKIKGETIQRESDQG